MSPISSISQRSTCFDTAPGTSTSTGRPVFGAMNPGRTTRAESLMSARLLRTQSDACHSSMTIARPIGVCTRSVVPVEASRTNRSQAVPPCGAARLRSWVSRR
jgi:hypothetical protein